MAIRLLALDVDGTLTDGGVYLDGEGREFKRFDIRDGMGIVRLRAAGVEIAFISGRFSAATAQRALDLGVSLVFNGVGDKLSVFKKIAEDLGIPIHQTAFMGDDVNDAECLRTAGMGIVPADGMDGAKRAADFVTASCAGHGAVRETAELILSRNEGSAA